MGMVELMDNQKEDSPPELMDNQKVDSPLELMDNQKMDSPMVGIHQPVDSLMVDIHKDLVEVGTHVEPEDKLQVVGGTQSTDPVDKHQTHDHGPFHMPSSKKAPCQ